jgi:hypothetical protein
MPDIVERLLVDSYVIPAATRLEAAAEIRRLRILVAHLEQSSSAARAILTDLVDALGHHTTLAEERKRMPLIEAAAKAFLAEESR